MNKKLTLEDLKLPLKDFHSNKSSQVFTVDSTLKELVLYFSNSSDQVISVVEGKKLKGIVSKNDVVYQLHRFFENEEGCKLSEIMISRPFVLNKNHTLWDALIMLAKKEVSAIAVTEENGDFYKIYDYAEIFDWIVESINMDITFHPGLQFWSYFDSNIMEVDFDGLEVGVIDERIFKYQCHHAITSEVLSLDTSIELKSMREIFKNYRLPQCVITNYGTKIQGVISAVEIIDYLIATNFKPDPTQKISDIMNVDIVQVMYKHTFKHGLSLLKEKNAQRLLVVDEDSFPVAIIRTFDFLKYLTDVLLSKDADMSVLSRTSLDEAV